MCVVLVLVETVVVILYEPVVVMLFGPVISMVVLFLVLTEVVPAV